MLTDIHDVTELSTESMRVEAAYRIGRYSIVKELRLALTRILDDNKLEE